jgi:hypothetical protein
VEFRRLLRAAPPSGFHDSGDREHHRVAHDLRSGAAVRVAVDSRRPLPRQPAAWPSRTRTTTPNHAIEIDRSRCDLLGSVSGMPLEGHRRALRVGEALVRALIASGEAHRAAVGQAARTPG